jgi:glycosyltransferase involved in cell wall biosynthesis
MISTLFPLPILLGRLKLEASCLDSREDYAGMLHGIVLFWMGRWIRWVENRFVRRVDLLITVGERLRRNFELRGCRRSVLVGNWKVPNEFRLSREVRTSVRRELGISDSALLLCFIGQLDKERRIRELLEAVAARPQVHLIVGGAGPELRTVQEYAQARSNIHYVGYLDAAGLRAYTWASDVIYYGTDNVNPNFRYSAPNKLFEALAAGKCIISGHFGEVEGIVSGTGCGVLVDDFSVAEIVRALDLCSIPDLLRRCQSNASRAGETLYTWERAEQQLLRSYEDLFNSDPTDY